MPVSLQPLDAANVRAHPAAWETVALKLRSRMMPPVGRPRPDEAAYDAVATWLEDELDRAAAAEPNPGRTVAHRLNRVEYGNAVRDLLGLEVDPEALLPPDDDDEGFDNIADVLSVSPTLMERYLYAARQVSQLAVGDAGLRPRFDTYRVPDREIQDHHTSDDLPFGTRGGIAVQHYSLSTASTASGSGCAATSTTTSAASATSPTSSTCGSTAPSSRRSSPAGG